MVYVSYAPPSREVTLDARRRLLAQCPRLIELTAAGKIRDTVELLSKIEQTSRLLTVKDRKVHVVAVDQPREVLTTLTVAGYLLPANGNNP